MPFHSSRSYVSHLNSIQPIVITSIGMLVVHGSNRVGILEPQVAVQGSDELDSLTVARFCACKDLRLALCAEMLERRSQQGGG